MIKKLRIKFVTVTMLFMSVTFCILFAADTLHSRYWDEKETLNILKWYAESDSFFEFEFDEEEITEAYGNPIFAIQLNNALEPISIKSSSTINRKAPTPEEIHAIFQKGTNRHKWKSYLYIISEQKDGYLLIITNKNEGISGIYRRIGTAVLILSGFSILFIISIILSNFVTKPAQNALKREKQFISDASHELKTPLAAISVNAEALKPSLPENRHLQNILSETVRMDGLIQKLLKLSYMDERGAKTEKQEFSLSECCEEMILTLESYIYEHKIKLDYQIDDNIRYKGNADDIKQVVAILLDNAIKHTPELGTISFYLKKQENKPVIIVKNSGDGIHPEDLPHIFERFYRTDHSRQQEGGSYGLGLAIAKAICDAHNASISAASEFGKETSFMIKL